MKRFSQKMKDTIFNLYIENDPHWVSAFDQAMYNTENVMNGINEVMITTGEIIPCNISLFKTEYMEHLYNYLVKHNALTDELQAELIAMFYGENNS